MSTAPKFVRPGGCSERSAKAGTQRGAATVVAAPSLQRRRPFYFQIDILRRALAWLSLQDISVCVAASRQFRYAALSPLVIAMHVRDVSSRVWAVKVACRIVSDQNTAQDLVACNVILSLMLMLQEGRSEQLEDTAEGSMLRDSSVRALRYLHRFRPQREDDGDGHKRERIPVGSKEDISDTAEAEMLDECLRIAGIPMIDNGAQEECPEHQTLSRPCFHIAYHCPMLLAPATRIVHPNIRGRPAVTVIERADSQRRLMYLGTFYLEGFCESEASRGKLGKELLFWYAKAVVAALAGANTVSGPRRRILILGLGAGVLPAFIQTHFPNVRCDVCEIHGGVVEAARQGFGLMDSVYQNDGRDQSASGKDNEPPSSSHFSSRIRVFVADCRDLIKTMIRSGVTYDAVVSDVYGDCGMPRCLCDVEYMISMRKLVEARKGTVIVNCGNEMADFDVLRSNFQWTFRNHTVELGHPDEENHILVGTCSSALTSDVCNSDSCLKEDRLPLLPSDSEWKDRVNSLIPPHMFSLFLVRKVADPAMFFVTFMDNHGICAADSLSQNATKLQYATKTDSGNE